MGFLKYRNRASWLLHVWRPPCQGLASVSLGSAKLSAGNLFCGVWLIGILRGSKGNFSFSWNLHPSGSVESPSQMMKLPTTSNQEIPGASALATPPFGMIHVFGLWFRLGRCRSKKVLQEVPRRCLKSRGPTTYGAFQTLDHFGIEIETHGFLGYF